MHYRPFKQYLKEQEKSEITPQDIYNFYYLTLLQSQPLNDEAEFKMALHEIKQKYLKAFRPIVVRQLQKYHKQGRVEKDADGDFLYGPDQLEGDNVDFGFLDFAMNATLRSDMKRRNENWNELTEHLNKLEKADSNREIIFEIDRINNTVHNTQALILGKFRNGKELVGAFDFAHNVKGKEDLKPYVSRDIRRIR